MKTRYVPAAILLIGLAVLIYVLWLEPPKLQPPEEIVFSSDRIENFEIYKTLGSGIVQLTNGGGRLPNWSADKKRIAFVNGGNIWIMNADGTNQKQLTDTEYLDRDPAWSADGMKIAFLRQSSHPKVYTLAVMDAEGGEVQLYGDQVENFAWSPKGRMLAFDFHRFMDVRAIQIEDFEGNRSIVAYNEMFGHVNPAWSPDGTQIAYMAQFGGEVWKWTVDFNGNPQGHTKIADFNDCGEHCSRFSSILWPSFIDQKGLGRIALFQGTLTEGAQSIALVYSDGSSKELLTTGGLRISDPCWYHSHASLVFSGVLEGTKTSDLYEIRIDESESEPDRITKNPADDLSPDC